MRPLLAWIIICHWAVLFWVLAAISALHPAEGPLIAMPYSLELNDAVVFATERDYAALAPGQAVELSTDAYPGERFEGRVERSVEAIHRSLTGRFDPRSVATARLEVRLRDG